MNTKYDNISFSLSNLTMFQMKLYQLNICIDIHQACIQYLIVSLFLI